MENSDSILLFKKLLLAVSETYQESNSPSSTNMEDWKGTDILNFQDELRSKNGSSVSEKWFYTYVKKTPNKLPRIDILNLLSNYAGFKDWTDFRNSHEDLNLEIIKNETDDKSTSKSPLNDRKKFWSKKRSVALLIIGIVALGFYVNTILYGKIEYEVCLVDYYDNLAIKNQSIDITILETNQSPIHLKTDSLSRFRGKTTAAQITFVVSSPYYQTDTITRLITDSKKIIVPIQTNDYALMLDFYANQNITEWNKRKTKLHNLIAEDAIIIELLPYQIGVTLYEKEDFIKKLTTPTKSLKRLEILETSFKNRRIQKIKFRMKS